MVFRISGLQFLVLGFLALGFTLYVSADITIENQEMRLVIGDNARAVSLTHKASGEQLLAQGAPEPLFTLTQYRPYDNEIQLAYPARPITYPAKSVVQSGDRLLVRFEIVNYEAAVLLKVTDRYVGFQFDGLRHLTHPDRRIPKADEALFLQLPIRQRAHFGDWLNVMWDDRVAVNLLASDPYAQIDSEAREGYRLLRATAVDEVRAEKVGAALIVTSTNQLLDRIDEVENDFDLPRGVASRRSPEYRFSYFWTGDITPENADQQIAYARQGGFRTLVIYYLAFVRSAGHYPWRPEYPDGLEDLKRVVDKVKAAGLVPGLHFHYNKAHRHDPYVTPNPDPRLNLARIFTLAEPLDEQSTTVTVEEDPRGCPTREDWRLLKIGNEIISYTEYTPTRPFRFLGCKRAQLGTSVTRQAAGMKFGLLDVDEWPVFIRFDQRTSIQDEAATRLSSIYNQAGFRFAYFDGAEDVHEPYWFMVSWAQWRVYRQLNPRPLFAEGACKAHFSWHILSRGNAFDNFAPEVIKAQTRRFPADEAPRIAEDFTGMDFGWVAYPPPSAESTGMQPDMFEFVTSRAAAWDCPISVQFSLEKLERHPRTADNLEVLRRWEEVRARRWLTEEQKRQLRNLEQEHLLLVNEQNELELVPYQEIPNPPGGKQVRAFSFDRAGKRYIVYWHVSGDGFLELPARQGDLNLLEELGQPGTLAAAAGGIKIPVGKRRYLESSTLDQQALIKAFQAGRLVE
ncbi:MAG: hypothetical protein EHM23_12255 [Acidobacteria bacterium]|nr:MAG: hypothetical protein EHM23_12255 [Acidobacteriota bacterium]